MSLGYPSDFAWPHIEDECACTGEAELLWFEVNHHVAGK